MSYEYDPTKAEQKAAKLLTDRGWAVKEPRCPLCHGNGYVPKMERLAETKIAVMGTFSSEPCPNGCVMPLFFYEMTTH